MCCCTGTAACVLYDYLLSMYTETHSGKVRRGRLLVMQVFDAESKEMAGAHALEEVVQFLLLFYRLFWPEENWYSRWARRESLVFVPFLKLRMPPFFVELPCHTLLFRLFELPPLLHVASSFPLRANKSDCRLLTIQYTITICLQASGETAVTKVTLLGLAQESAFCCQILQVQASD